MKALISSILFCYILIIFQFQCYEFTRLRGVAKSKQSFYSDAEWFTCIDGSGKIPFSKVNDDYCDCPDSSDEPGTSACPNGVFHCTNAGHIPKNIPSSRVNDGICDCCDTSDEYAGPGSKKCVNNCKELGKAEREKRQKEAILQNEGYERRQTYLQDGIAKHKERQEQLEKLKLELQEAEQIKENKEAIKNAAEEPEKQAKEEHENKWKEEVKLRKTAAEREAATAAFEKLDENNDGILTTAEIMLVQGFDKDKDGAVTHEEAMAVLEQEQIDKESFITRLWGDGGFSIIYSELTTNEEEKKEETDAEPTDVPPPEPTQHPETDLDDDDEDYEDYDDEHDHDLHEDEQLRQSQEIMDAAKRNKERRKKADKEAAGEMPDWDESTKKLIEIADNARTEFDEANKKYNDINSEISNLEKLRGKDFGPDQEFAILQGQCFELTDREYTYKLCPFEKSTQQPKNGGSETSLGMWGEWAGPPDNKYSIMKYTRGKSCWNGPDRSTDVMMKCGKENAILSATEPEKCLYRFEFTTPALCKTQIKIDDYHPTENDEKHDEL